MAEGVYALGTGNSGAGGAFATLGCAYGLLGATAAQFTRLPPPAYAPEGFVADENSTAGTKIGLPRELAIKTPQFGLLWLTVFGNATGGLALLSSSKLIMTDVFSGAMPLVVTSAFATTYVAALGGANSLGRLGWAVASDHIGRKTSYALFGLGIPVMAGAPYVIHAAVEGASGAELSLTGFYAGSVLAISFYGGLFSVLPAYIADLFGQKHAGAIHGSALTAWAASAVCGPMGLAQLRNHAEKGGIDDLLSKCDATQFESAFGAPMEQASALVDAKTVTIARLMEIVPAGTVDPTPFLYDTTCYAAAGLLGVAAIANASLRPPDVPKLLAEAAKAKAAKSEA